MSIPRCAARRAAHVCGTPMIECRDRLVGRLSWACPACRRCAAGICADCPAPVAGTVGKSLRCAPCRREDLRRRSAAYWAEKPAGHAARAKRRYRRTLRLRQGATPLTAREAGLRGGPARAQALTPERRREIARLGGLARAAHWRARQAGAA